MNQPDSPIRHGLSDVLLGPIHVQSGVEYVVTSERPTHVTSVVLPSTDPLIADIHIFMSTIVQRLDQITHTLDYLALPWYKRLWMWARTTFSTSSSSSSRPPE